MFGRRKRDRVLVLCAGERRLLTMALLSFRNKLVASGKPAEDINELLIRHLRAPLHRRRGDQQELASLQAYAGEEPLQPHGGLSRTFALEQVVGPDHDD